MGNYLAFDLGASSGRAIIGTLKNGKLSLQEVHRFGNGPVEKNGSLFWDYESLQNELVSGLGKAVATGVKLDGISIDTWGVDYLFFDRSTRKMLRPPYNYRDRRTLDAAEKISKLMDKSEIYQASGIQYMTLNTIFQLFAHKEQHPEDMENGVFLPIPDALAFALGGDFTAEYTHCSTFALLDPATRQWNWELISRLGLSKEIFPEIVPPCSANGQLKKELCEKFNIPPIPIFKCGSHDTASAVLAVPAPPNRNWAYLSAGTWALLGVESSVPVVTPASGAANVTNEGGVGDTIRFLTNIMGSWLFQELKRVWNSEGKNLSFNDIESMARNEKMCRYFVDPNCADFAAPGDMPGNIRNFCRSTGQTGNLSDSEVARTVYDSLALCFRQKLELIESLQGVKYQCLNIVGGGTKDRFLMQLTASALNRQVITGPVEATASGNILAQAIASGEISGISEAREVVRNSFKVETFEPDAADAEIYQQNYGKFGKITEQK